MDPLFALSTVACAVLAYFLVRKCLALRSRPSLPPGPPAKPFTGNILQVPSGGAWHFFMKCKQKYGDLLFFHGLGNSILVVNSLPSINELLERRWNIYSDRPTFTAVGELMGVNQSLALMRYGEEWREHRKITHTVLNAAVVKRWHSTQEVLATMLIRDLLADPDEFFAHIRLAAARLVLYVGYGLFADDLEDPYIVDNEKTMDILGEGLSPGAFLCDLLPILKYSPSWVPFQRRIAKAKEIIHRTVYLPYRDIQKRVEHGTALPSLARDLITSGEYLDPDLERRAIWAVSSMYGAGTETTFSAVVTFILAMALYPDVQKRAQTEVDQVVGDRIPTIADMAQLPYTRALIKETLRWHPPVPLSLPRCTSDDDIYQGYFIPRGTIVLPNIWAISRDTQNPEKFDPDRFLNSSTLPVDPFDYVFGFGRRVCTGRYLAENSISGFISGILWAFDINQLPGQTLKPEFVPKNISFPEKFKCSIVPRSAAKAETVRQRAAEVKVGEV